MSTPFAYPKQINSRSDVADGIAFFQKMGGAALLRVPPLRALHQGRIAYLDVGPQTPARLVKSFIALVDRPALVIVADDGDQPVGPKQIPQLARLMRWSCQIVIHGAGGEIEQYECAVSTAEAVGRLLLIECPSHLVDSYKTFAERAAPRVPGFTIKPPAGHFHPLPDSPAPVGWARC